MEEVEQLVRDYLPLPADRRLPDGWLVNLDNVPVAPPLTGKTRLEYIQSLWQAEIDALTEEERSRLPPFNASTVYWDVLVDAEYAGRLHSFSTTDIDHEPPLPPPSCVGR